MIGRENGPLPDGVGMLLDELASRPPLPHNEVLELFQKIRGGDKGAVVKVIEHNLRLVARKAMEAAGPGQRLFGDMFQEGALELMHAVENFNPNKGAKFATYASLWIKHGIREAVEKSRTIRIPRHGADYRARIREAEEQLLKEGREPTVIAISEKTRIRPDIIGGLARGQPIGLSGLRPGNDTDMSPVEIIEDATALNPEEEGINAVTRLDVHESIRSVCLPIERAVLEYLFGLNGKSPISFDEVGKLLGVTSQRVRQIKASAFKKLRKIPELWE